MRHVVAADWDLVVIDRLLPGEVDGLAIVRKLRDLGKVTLVIVVSALGASAERVRGLREGADDYISKPFAISELIARIEALNRRQEAKSYSPRLQVADLTLDARTFKVMRGNTVIELQRREFQLLTYLMRHEDQVVTRSMLLEAVWGSGYMLESDVVDVQISRLRTKVDKGFRPILIHTVRGVGYVFGERH